MAERRRAPRLRTALLALATGLAVWVWIGESEGDVRVLPEAELHALSPWLESGYRSRSGTGPLFVGTLSPAWDGLEADAREANARRLVRTLLSRGVGEVMVYDSDRRVRLRAAEGLSPRFDDEPSPRG